MSQHTIEFNLLATSMVSKGPVFPLFRLALEQRSKTVWLHLRLNYPINFVGSNPSDLL